MKRLFSISLLLVVSVHLVAQNKEDAESIKSLCGCFEVTFMYAETFSADTAYKYSNKYRAKGLEYVVAEESNPTKYVLQHLLVADEDIIKHWREDWVYQDPKQLQFVHSGQWKPVTLKPEQVKGQWTQSVWEVDDAPRYMGTASWIHADGKNYWENVADAPLPRREYTKRNDYNVMRRGNRIRVTDTGWVHEQDNDKVVRKENTPDYVLAQEKGWNIYKKVDDSKCALAAKWWNDNKAYWNVVRKSWDTILKNRKDVHLQAKVDNKLLYQYLFDTQNEFTHETVTAAELPGKINSILTRFVQ
ncbi:MAG: DUF6607 family protein [Flavitalea sp.]